MQILVRERLETLVILASCWLSERTALASVLWAAGFGPMRDSCVVPDTCCCCCLVVILPHNLTMRSPRQGRDNGPRKRAEIIRLLASPCCCRCLRTRDSHLLPGWLNARAEEALVAGWLAGLIQHWLCEPAKTKADKLPLEWSANEQHTQLMKTNKQVWALASRPLFCISLSLRVYVYLCVCVRVWAGINCEKLAQIGLKL